MILKRHKFSLVCLSFSLILLSYTVYKSVFIYELNRNDYYLIYYIVFTSFLCFSIISFFFNKYIIRYLTIIFLSLIFSIYLFEAYMVFYKPLQNRINIENDFKERTGNDYDTRLRHEIYNDLKKEDPLIQIAIHPSFYLKNKNIKLFPLSGISNSRTIHCNENGYYSIYDSDRYGFNNPDDQWNFDEVEYLLVGDSYVHGACVNSPYDIASVLRNISNKSVINIGYRGNGPLIEYAGLREYLNTNVKKVLWFYYEGNDLADLKKELNNNILRKYLENLKFNQNLKSKQKYIDELSINVKDSVLKQHEEYYKIKNSILGKFIKFSKLGTTRATLVKYRQINYLLEIEEEFKKILKLTDNLTQKNNSELYFIYLPEYRRYHTKYDNTNYNKIKKIMRDLNINFIDIHKEVFEKETEPKVLFPYTEGGHYNIIGYSKIATEIYKLIK